MGRKLYYQETVHRTFLDLPLLAFLAINLATILVAKDISQSLRLLAELLSLYLVYYLTINIVSNGAILKNTILVALWSSILVSLWGLFQYFAYASGKAGIPYAEIAVTSWSSWIVPRLKATALEPAFFANYLLSVLPLAMALVLYRGYSQIKRKWLVL